MEPLEATTKATRVPPARALPKGTPTALRKWWPLLAGGVVLVAIVLILLPPKVLTTHLTTMTLRDEAAGTGFVRAKVTIGIGAKINGVVLKTYVDQGDIVKKGQILAELQNQDAQSQVGQAASLSQAQQATLSSARANLSASKARLQASISAVGKSQAGLRLAEINYGRAKSLYDGGVFSKEAFDTAETARLQAQEDLRNSQALQNSAEDQVRGAEADVGAAERILAGSEAGVRLQQANLQYTIVSSPVDGYVVSRDLEEGGTVVPGLAIFTVAQSSVIWVSANIDEREIGGLRVGQPATIALRSAPGRKFSGVVARIAKEADPVTEEVVVDVAFAEQPHDLKLNETAEVYILKSERKEAKAIPMTAIISGREGPAVWMVVERKLQPRPISLGVRDKRGLVEVLSGISASDAVLVQPNAAGMPLVPGKRVRTSQAKATSAEAR
jgi:HlyD family secretion protein